MPTPLLDDPANDADNPDQADERLDELENAETAEEHTEQDTEDLETVEIDATDMGGELFDGTEDAYDDSDDPFGEPEGGDATPFGEDDDGPSEALVEAINEGAARAAVVGLDDTEEKDDLREEFEEVFATFKLGHFGGLTFEEHLKEADDDIDPVWGLVGAMLLCSMVVLYKRPDGDEMINNATSSLGLDLGFGDDEGDDE